MQQPEEEKETAEPIVRPRIWISVFGGVVAGLVLVALPYFCVLFLSRHYDRNGLPVPQTSWIYNNSLMLLTPVVQGLGAGLLIGRAKQKTSIALFVIMLIWAVQTAFAAICLSEGVICLIMAAPLLWGLIGIGYGLGRGLVAIRKGFAVSVSLAPFILLAVVLETQGPVPDYHAVVIDKVTVNAPPEYVWRYIVDYPDNPTPPDYWLWKIGLPEPTHSVAPIQAVGARRDCRFSGHQSFEERITELEPDRKLTFVITRQPQHPEIIGHINIDQGQMVLTANPDGTTTITATSWYRLHVRPAAYFNLWAEDVTRHVHFRVMGYMKALAERDYARVKKGET